jgi:hypothetical protein
MVPLVVSVTVRAVSPVNPVPAGNAIVIWPLAGNAVVAVNPTV